MRSQLYPGLASARQCIAALEAAQDLDAAITAGRAFDQAPDADRWQGAWDLSWRGWQERLAQLWVADAGLPEQTLAAGDAPPTGYVTTDRALCEPLADGETVTEASLGEVLDDDVVEQIKAPSPAPVPRASRAPYVRSLAEVAERGRGGAYRGRRRFSGHGRPR